MVCIWAEENATLRNTTFEWAFGNGANMPSNQGVIAYVPTGYTCAVVAMGLSLASGTATVEVNLNGVNQGSKASVTVSTGASNMNELASPLTVVSGDRLNFRTLSASGTGTPNVACMWLKFTSV
jgi:hypothetical protein